jgi:hypothetical protein
MDGKVFVLLILLIVFGSITIQNRMKHNSKRDGKKDDAEQQALKARVAELEDRVRVLERIVTDRRERLKEEIDAL